MKKLLLLSLVLIPLSLFSKDIKTLIICNGAESETYEDSVISMNVKVSSGRYFLLVEIENKTDERIYVEWENARIKDGKVIFGNDSPLTMSREKPDEAIAKGGKCKKEISSNHYYSSSTSGLLPIVYKKTIKKKGFQLVDINIPIKYKGESIDIPLTLKFVFD